MADLKRLAALPGGPQLSASELVCASCNRPLAGGLTFTATGGVDDGAALFCESCRGTHLGPPCRGCGLPAPRADALVALDAHWHRACLKCAEPGCGAALGETYFEWAGEPRCHAHYVQHAAPRCEGCGEAVDGGLRALGRVWHDGCLRCEVSGAVLREGTFYVHEGRTIAKEARAETAPLCAACGEPALEGRLFAMGKARRRNSAPCSILLRAQLGHGPPPRSAQVFHDRCFKCVHCHAPIGDRRFVEFEGEPYLDGCYQKLFGYAAPETQQLLQGERRRYAALVPLQHLGKQDALERFRARHAELFPTVRRELRERGLTEVRAFVFAPPAVTKPSLALHFVLPAEIDATDAFRQLLAEERHCAEWEQLVASNFDTSTARGRAWWESISPELAE